MAKVLSSSAITVNLDYVDVAFPENGDEWQGQGQGQGQGKTFEGWDIEIGPGDEVGVIPPVSSG